MKRKDINTLRVKHKLRLDIKSEKEIILCTGDEQRMQVSRFFWQNVTCIDCKAKRK